MSLIEGGRHHARMDDQPRPDDVDVLPRPDGNQVELQVDNFPSAETLAAWFRSGAFARNPIGVTFDPERLLARYRAGEPMAELVKRDDQS